MDILDIKLLEILDIIIIMVFFIKILNFFFIIAILSENMNNDSFYMKNNMNIFNWLINKLFNIK